MIPVPPELVQQLEQGQPSKEKKSYEGINPLMENEDFTKILRANNLECPIPGESKQLNELVKRLASLDPSEELLETLAKGVAVILCADKFCDAQVKRRSMIKFKDDEHLAMLHSKVTTLVQEINDLDRLRVEKLEEIKQVAQQRWDVAVKNFGLNPADRLYSISEQDSDIQLLDLDCLACKGATKIRKARQEIAEALMRLSSKKESPDDQGTDGKQLEDSGEDRETPVEE